MGKKILYGVLALLLILVSVVLVRTFTFGSRQVNPEPITHIAIGDDAIERFASSLTYKTISWQEAEKFDSSEFRRFQAFLKEQFPLVDSLLEKQMINNLTLLYKWQGKNPDLKPILLMAHQDVVPVDTEKLDVWDEMPFSGKVANGYVYGRGAQDVKCQLMSLHEAAEYLLSKGYQPERSIYFSFGHDEELGGPNGAKKVAEYFEKNNIEIEFLVDEGGAIMSGAVPGVSKPVAVIGIAEKGYATFELTVNEKGGHSSMPPRETAIGILSNAVARLEANPYPIKITGVTSQMFDFVGPEMSFTMKMAMANRWLFSSLIISELSKGNSARATLHTTTAPTIIGGGTKENVLPTTAKAIVNHRVLPGNSIEFLLKRDKEIINDERVEVRLLESHDAIEASPVSDVNAESFQALQKTISEVFPEAVVTPFLDVGGTDSKHFYGVTDNIYRFQPMRANDESLGGIHGNNERHSIENYKETINFFIQLIKNTSTQSN